jgi:hypothetical protein
VVAPHVVQANLGGWFGIQAAASSAVNPNVSVALEEMDISIISDSPHNQITRIRLVTFILSALALASEIWFLRNKVRIWPARTRSPRNKPIPASAILDSSITSCGNRWIPANFRRWPWKGFNSTLRGGTTIRCSEKRTVG